MTNRRRRFWWESALATAGVGLLVVTLFAKDWIEVLVHVDPDHGDGSLELQIVALLLTATVGMIVLACREFRRPRSVSF
jgi:hypothetical protein